MSSTGRPFCPHLPAATSWSTWPRKISIRGDRDGEVRRTNVEGNANVVAAARAAGVDRFVHVSSVHAMRLDGAAGVADESRPLVGEGAFAYDRSKAEGERIVLGAAADGFSALVLRPTGIIGPHDFRLSRAGAMLREFYRGERPFLIPGGFDWVDARDVAATIVAAVARGRVGHAYLLSGNWVSIADLARLCGEIGGTERRRLVLPRWTALAALPFVETLANLRSGEPLFTRGFLPAGRGLQHAQPLVAEGSRRTRLCRAAGRRNASRYIRLVEEGRVRLICARGPAGRRRSGSRVIKGRLGNRARS